MKRKASLLISLLLLSYLLPGCGKETGRNALRPEDFSLEPVRFSPAAPERWKLANGLTVLFLHNAELPLVSGTLYIPGGSLWEPADLAGVARATGAQMREGGVTGYPPLALDKRLNNLAANVESSFGDEYGSVSFSSLSEDFDETFRLFSLVVRRPSFDSKRLALWKSLALEGVKRRRDDPSIMASMALAKVVYGDSSPYARYPAPESISRISVADLRSFHSKFVQPNGAILAVTGSIARERIDRALSQHLVDWQGEVTNLEPPAVNEPARPGIYVLERDFDQATVVFAHLGPPRHTPDMHPMTIFNRVFGSAGFESLLFSEIRSRLGLAYAVDGSLSPAVVAGLFEIGLGTRVEEVPRAVRAVLELVTSTQREPFNSRQIAAAKSAVERSFVFKFAENEQIVNRAALLDILGYPKDFDQTYLARIEAVGPREVFDVAKRWIRPDDLSIVIVGRVRASDLAREFSGTFNVYEVKFDTEPVVGKGPVQ